MFKLIANFFCIGSLGPTFTKSSSASLQINFFVKN